MTIQKALDRLDEMKPNAMGRHLKVAWLAEIDGLIHHEIIMKHEHSEEDERFDEYTEMTDEGTELIAPFPYDELYTYWLMSKVDMQNLEWDKYNNDRQLFNSAYNMFHDWWRREHMPLTHVRELRI